MPIWNSIINNLPEVAGPTQKFLSFKEKLRWTGIVLVIFFILGLLPLFGLGENSLQTFEQLSIILGAKFGSIISLGIGPLVTASIVLQLLNGSGILKFDLTSHEGKRNFQGVQKLLSIFFILFEAAIYVFLGGLSPPSGFAGTPLYFQLELLLIFQLFLGGIMILFMDEVVSKWGFGSGISLFIAAGVSEEIFIRAFNWLPGPGSVSGASYAIGAVPRLLQSLIAGDPQTAFLALFALLATALVFAIAVYAQAMKVEIPLSFGRIRGHGIRWPLAFLYTSNIPVILVAALMANVQLWARLVQNWAGPADAGSRILDFISMHIFGQIGTAGSGSGIIQYINPPNILDSIVKGSFGFVHIKTAFIYMLFMMIGAVIFSIFWVQTAGMDAKSQAKQMMSSGLQIPGFRKDERVLEHLLNRYIWPLTIMGGLAVGLLAGLADLTGALSRGTGILLAVMIIYRLYEDIARQHMMDINPMMRNVMGM